MNSRADIQRRITIVDSGGANISSITAALARLGYSAQFSSDAHTIKNSSHVILPGVGAAANAMQKLQQLKLIETLQSLTQPVLGICLGMQLLFEFSEEDHVACLGIIPGTVKKLTPDQSRGIRIPHMGWNTIRITQTNALTTTLDNHISEEFQAVARRRRGENERVYPSYIIEGEPTRRKRHSSKSNRYVYFVHSYAVPVTAYTCATTEYGETFSAITHYKNFFATQFHPERSAQVGQQILKNFLSL